MACSGLAFIARGPLDLGFTIMTASITLALLVLPVVILVAREAIRAIPPSIREGSLALGATQWQTIRRQVLPAAIPGIATGVILAISRAIGETAVLLPLGAATFLTSNPSGPTSDITAIPLVIFNWVKQPNDEFRVLAAAGIIVLIALAGADELVRDLPQKPLRATLVGDNGDGLDQGPIRRDDDRRGQMPARIAVHPDHFQKPGDASTKEKVFELQSISVSYGENLAVKDVSMDIHKGEVTALIGPSGCGKSTLIRCMNRMNDLVPSALVEGKLLYHGEDLYGPKVDPVQVRKLIGMVFQKPNPFPKSIYDNIAFGPRILGMKGDMDETVEKALRGAALWDEVKDRLDTNAFGMSGGQQQRLCIARCIAVEPDVILMDEPCSALDPISTGKIEDLMMEMKRDYLDRDRHPQHAAGRARLRPDRLPDGGARCDRTEPVGQARRVRRDPEDVHQPLQLPYRGLRERKGGLRCRIG